MAVWLINEINVLYIFPSLLLATSWLTSTEWPFVWKQNVDIWLLYSTVHISILDISHQCLKSQQTCSVKLLNCQHLYVLCGLESYAKFGGFGDICTKILLVCLCLLQALGGTSTASFILFAVCDKQIAQTPHVYYCTVLYFMSIIMSISIRYNIGKSMNVRNISWEKSTS